MPPLLLLAATADFATAAAAAAAVAAAAVATLLLLLHTTSSVVTAAVVSRSVAPKTQFNCHSATHAQHRTICTIAYATADCVSQHHTAQQSSSTPELS
jgi:hypothetical protein